MSSLKITAGLSTAAPSHCLCPRVSELWDLSCLQVSLVFCSLISALQNLQLVWARSFSAAEFGLWAEVRSPQIILKGKEKRHTWLDMTFHWEWTH